MINLIVALPAEARPLIQRFGLKPPQNSCAFPIYAGEAIRLIRSGPGKTAARTAVEQLRASFSEPDAWLNLGIAGHPYHPLGTPLLAHKITDRETGQSWKIAFPFPLPCETTELITVDHPEKTYAASCAYDMEASGFIAAARRAARTDQVHCLKIVSDNPRSGYRQISGKKVEDLVEQNLELIDRLVRTLND